MNPDPISVRVERIAGFDSQLPTKGTELRAYYDVYSAEDVLLIPGEVVMVHTGLKIQPLRGWFLDVRPRSGLAKMGVTINNSPGTVDCDYGGELMIELIYHATDHSSYTYTDDDEVVKKGYMTSGSTIIAHKRSLMPFGIKAGDRIAQISVMPMYTLKFLEVDKIEGTEGFGSTGA